jgi:hypothetical protein
VIVYSQKLKDLQDALSGVVVNAQALAAADLAIGTLITARDRFSAWSLDNARRWAYDQLADAVNDVQRFRGPFEGQPAAPVNPSSWDDLQHAIARGYNRMWSISTGPIGEDSEWDATLSWLADTAAGSVAAIPDVLSAAVHGIAGFGTEIIGGAAKGLLPLWPIVAAGVAVVVVGAIVLAAGRKRGLVA